MAGKLTPADKEHICSAYQAGASCPELARELGVAYQSVHRIVRLAGILRNRSEAALIARAAHPPPRIGETISDEALYRLHWTEKLTLSEMAERMGCGPTTVLGEMKRRRIPRRGQQAAVKVSMERGRWFGAEFLREHGDRTGAALAKWRAEHPEEAAAAGRRSLALAHRLKSHRNGKRPHPCSWCSATVLRWPSRMRTSAEHGGRVCCSPSCGAALRRFAADHPDEPRPLILELLRQGADPQEIGAGEIELRELELEKTLEALNVRAA